MPIQPDTKDWTWVLDRPCPECGFDASSLPTEQIVSLIGATAPAWSEVLDGPPAKLCQRPADDNWSILEYGCHVRDVFRLYDVRLHLMLDQDNPTFPNWDQDRSAVEEGYGTQDPAVVATELVRAADALGSSFRTVTGGLWGRRGNRSDGASFTVDSFGRYMIHDPVHHLYDVDFDLAGLWPRPPGAKIS
jgi:hypothetical protein